MRAASTALRGCRWRITRSGKADEERRVEGRFKAATREGMRERNLLEKERERERDGLRRVEARWEHNGGFKGVRDRDKGRIRLLEERGME